MENFRERLESLGPEKLPLFFMMAMLSACGNCDDVNPSGEGWKLEEELELGMNSEDLSFDMSEPVDLTESDMGVDLGEEDMGGDMSKVVKEVTGYTIINENSNYLLGYNNYYQVILNSDYDCKVNSLRFFPDEGYEEEFESNIQDFRIAEATNVDHTYERYDSYIELAFIEPQSASNVFDIVMRTNLYGKDLPGMEIVENAYFLVEPHLSEDCVLVDELKERYRSRIVNLYPDSDPIEGYSLTENLRSGSNLVAFLNFDGKDWQNLDSVTGLPLEAKLNSTQLYFEYSDNVTIDSVRLEDPMSGEIYEGEMEGDMVKFTFEEDLLIDSGEILSFLVYGVFNVELNEFGNYEGTDLKVNIKNYKYTSSDTNGTHEYNIPFSDYEINNISE